jgi:O-antigen/teichoic acid export membrane protein
VLNVTSEERAGVRKSKILKTLSLGAYAKVVGVVVSFVMVPLAVGYLGSDGYGLWIAVSSLITLLSFADGGAGNALLNMVSHATGVDSKASLKGIVASGFYVLVSIAIIGASLILLLSPHINWAWVFGIAEGVDYPQLKTLVLIVSLAFFIGMPLSVVGNVQRGLQEGNIQEFWNAKGRLLSLVFVYMTIRSDLGLAFFALAVVAGPIVAAFGNGIYYFLIRKKELLPDLASVNRADVSAVLGTGSLFLVLQITSSIQMSADNIIISNMIGPSAVTRYAVCMQLFMVVPMAMGLLWAPLWPAYREAIASGDVDWVKRVFIKSLKFALLIGLTCAVTLCLFAEYIIQLWVGDELVPSILLVIGCGIWLILSMVGGALAVFLNALQLMKIQILTAVAAGVVNIIVSIFLIKYIGILGAIYGSIIAYILCAVIPCLIVIPNILMKPSIVRKEALYER